MKNSSFDPVPFFRELGGLHDSEIHHLTWDAAAGAIKLDLDDLNANFDRLPEYQGKRRGAIVFAKVENILWNCDAIKGDVQRIYKLVMRKKDDSEKYELMLRISPSGQLSFDCESVEIIDLPG